MRFFALMMLVSSSLFAGERDLAARPLAERCGLQRRLAHVFLDVFEWLRGARPPRGFMVVLDSLSGRSGRLLKPHERCVFEEHSGNWWRDVEVSMAGDEALPLEGGYQFVELVSQSRDSLRFERSFSDTAIPGCLPNDLCMGRAEVKTAAPNLVIEVALHDLKIKRVSLEWWTR
jgi:hypothetical protein